MKLKHLRLMRSNASLLSLIAAAVLAATPAHAEWKGFVGRCPLCVGAGSSKKALPVAITNNTLVYYVVGEFASAPSMWIIDLDQGRISDVPFQDATPSNIDTKSIDDASLEAIRSAAKAAWQRRTRSKLMTFPPGTTFALEIFSGDRMVSLDPFDRRSKALVSAIETAGAKTSGSFVTFP